MEKTMLEMMQDLYLADNWSDFEVEEDFRNLCSMLNVEYDDYTTYDELYDALKPIVIEKSDFIRRFDNQHIILQDNGGTYALVKDITPTGYLAIISTSDDMADFEDFRTEYEQFNTKTASLLVLKGTDLRPKQDGICAVLRDDTNGDLYLLEQNITKAEQVEKIWEQMRTGIMADLSKKVKFDIFGKFLHWVESDEDLDHEEIQAVIDYEI